MCVHVFAFTLVTAPLLAQSAATPPSVYNHAAEVAVAGTIIGVEPYPSAEETVGVHIVVNTGREVVRIHVAPAMYIGQNNFYFLVDDRVSVIGARVSGQSAVWARTIMKGSAMLVLRNQDGTPRWTPAADGTDGCGVDHAPLVRTTDR
jgi:hypothetical protein